MKWRNLLMPKEIQMDEAGASAQFGRFRIEPLERGFGNTIGNAIRRTLLSSIQGAAVTAVTTCASVVVLSMGGESVLGGTSHRVASDQRSTSPSREGNAYVEAKVPEAAIAG